MTFRPQQGIRGVLTVKEDDQNKVEGENSATSLDQSGP